ncbi:MAG: hypothetical protein ABIV93_30925 [Byssovorax sp.]
MTGSCDPGESWPPYDAGPHDAGKGCAGVCLKAPPTAWFGPELVWMGDEAAAPACPESASIEAYTGHGYLDGPIQCDACTCGPTSGSCELPATVTAASASCAGDGSGVAHTSSDPPDGWFGLCNGEDAIPAGKLCGGVPCVQSVTIAPLTPKQTGCLPNENTNVSPPPWNRFVRACAAAGPRPGCTKSDEFCVPAAPGPEFKQCVASRRDDPALNECPPGYPERSVFYPGPAPKCAPCGCAAPTGSTCTGEIKLYQDGTCNTPLAPPVSVDATGPVCVNVPPGSALGSKAASKPSYTPGSCEPIVGVTEGTVFCCIP